MNLEDMSDEEFNKAYLRRALGFPEPNEPVSNNSEAERILQKFEDISDLISSRVGTIDKFLDKLSGK